MIYSLLVVINFLIHVFKTLIYSLLVVINCLIYVFNVWSDGLL